MICGKPCVAIVRDHRHSVELWVCEAHIGETLAAHPGYLVRREPYYWLGTGCCAKP